MRATVAHAMGNSVKPMIRWEFRSPKAFPMIRYLAIRNLAVIESVAVDFEQSFNILTGETGAGKSILVEAVGLLLGGRASQDLVRTGEDLATVEAIFETEDGSELIVRREITAQGRSRAFINGALATAAALKDLSNRLVELHGQHEHQQLLDPAQHLRVLDAWAGLDAARARRRGGVRRACAALREQLDRLRMDDRERAARLELVEFQLGELQKANAPAQARTKTLGARAAAAAQRRHHPAALRRELRGAVRLRRRRRSPASAASGSASASWRRSIRGSRRTSTRATASRRSSRTWRSRCATSPTASTRRRGGCSRSRIGWRCSSG